MSPDQIAECAILHYKSCLTKGKPKAQGEWTVYAAIVAEQGDKLWVLSCATGTKCTANRSGGFVLHDSHAEVLARRGLMRVLCKELSKGNQSSLLECQPTGKFKLWSDISLHLYISRSPCGDASIYAISKDEVTHTGAKIVVLQRSDDPSSQMSGGNLKILEGTNVAREKVQDLGKVRVKSGRSDLPADLRSSSMCCSDKLVCWQAIGMQGAILSRVIEDVRLSSIVVSHDLRIPVGSSAQKEALIRAVPDRVRRICTEVPSLAMKQIIPRIHVVSAAFPFDKAVVESRGFTNDGIPTNELTVNEPKGGGIKRKRGELRASVPACGVSINWQCCDVDKVEILVGARGVLQGRTPKKDFDYERLSSRLSRRGLLREIEQAGIRIDRGHLSYRLVKQELADPNWLQLKTRLLAEGTLSGWLRSDHGGDFCMEKSTGS